MSGGSHTNFNSGAFTAGALGGAATLAGALACGFQNYMSGQRDRWAAWTMGQLRVALDLSESMRYHQFVELQRANARIADLERAAADRAFIIRREQARTLPRRR